MRRTAVLALAILAGCSAKGVPDRDRIPNDTPAVVVVPPGGSDDGIPFFVPGHPTDGPWAVRVLDPGTKVVVTRDPSDDNRSPADILDDVRFNLSGRPEKERPRRVDRQSWVSPYRKVWVDVQNGKHAQGAGQVHRFHLRRADR